jgi:hypothetical protein
MNLKLNVLFNKIKADSIFLTVSEAQTSQGIVLPILNNLGWDVFDTSEVTPEYSVAGKRVDFALRIQSQNKVFLEIKKTSEDLEKHHEQLVYYAFQQGVKLAILTNGITWQFYLPLEEGSWEQRKFFTIDLMEQAIGDAIEKFESLLSRKSIESGNASLKAKSLYEGKQKNKIIKENLPKAWQKLVSEPDEMLVVLLNETLEKICGYKAEESQIIEFFYQIFSNPNTFSQVQKVQKIQKTVVPEKAPAPITPSKNDDDLIKLNSNHLEDLSFTRIIEGKFANSPAIKWRNLLDIGFRLAHDKGITIETLQNELTTNFKLGKHTKNGFSPVEGTNFSAQGQSANHSANNLLKLAKFLTCEVYVLLEWGEKGRFPMKKGLFHWKP